ncbi:hypothetical protein Tco_0650497 [Tanacetum coccineum]
MMTYLKHVGNFKHAELKIKKFEEVRALYEKIKRSDEDFISIGSAKDERLNKRMNEKGVNSSKDEMIKEESKEEESTRKRKLGTRKKIKSRKRRYIQNTSEDDSDKENDELRLLLTIAPDEENEVDYEILERKYPIKEWKTECLGTKPQTDQAEHIEEINQNVGDLMVMFNPDDEGTAKFLHDTIAAQRKFLAQQRSEAIRNRPPTKNQLRNQMMTYLKHVGNFKHAELKIKKFEEVQALYEKIKRSDEDFISIGSVEDERLIKRMNEKGVDSSKNEVIKEEVQEESIEDESTRKRKLGTRKKMKSRKRRYIQNTSEDDSEKENDELRLHLTIAPDEEKEVDYEILDRKYPIKEWKTECLGTKPQTNQAEDFEEINQNVVIRSNGQKRYFSTLMRVLSIFDREDLNAVYKLVMDRFQDEMSEGFHRKLHSSSGVHTLVTETGLVIHMLVEKKYPLRKEVLVQMLKLKLESEEDSTMALELIRHKNWLVHKQTACGKDFSNPFMVDNLPKIVRFSTHLASVVKSWLVHDQTVHALASPKANELTIPEQTATGKGTSNPLMAGSLPKTIKPT